VAWRLVDEALPRPSERRERAEELAGRSERQDATGIEKTPLAKTRTTKRSPTATDGPAGPRARGLAEITVTGAEAEPPASLDALHEQGAGFWTLAITRELGRPILDLRNQRARAGHLVLPPTATPRACWRMTISWWDHHGRLAGRRESCST